MKKLPAVGVTSCHMVLDYDRAHYCTRTSFFEPLLEASQTLPLIIPSVGGELLYNNSLLENIYGLVMTGSLSNINPKIYGQDKISENYIYDDKRDDTTLFLIKKAIEQGMPMVGVCRGFQEFVVALGGDLYQKVQQEQGKQDHRTDYDGGKEKKEHSIKINKGGLLEKIANKYNINSTLGEDEFMVNSSHAQAAKTLGKDVFVEAVSSDGVVEAVSFEKEKGFFLAVQWHPEINWKENPLYRAIFEEFGKEVKKYMQGKKNENNNLEHKLCSFAFRPFRKA